MVETPAPERKYVRLHALPITSLPDHPSLAKHQTTSESATTTAPPPPSLQTFTALILNEAEQFAKSTFPDKFKVKGSSRPSPPSTARVDLLTADLPAANAHPNSPPGQGKTETWFARRSSHKDAAETGTATWKEFEEGLFRNHSENEGVYTPEVFDARPIVHWDFEQSDASGGQGVEGWTDVGMEIYEMGHKIPPPLQNRVFALLIVRGKPDGGKNGQDFITAQIPVDLSSFDGSFYSNGRHRKEGDSAIRKEKVIIGEYAAVERVRKLDDGMIVWEMATASDAKGWLPMGLQKTGIPAAIIRDVGLFLDWADKERQASNS